MKIPEFVTDFVKKYFLTKKNLEEAQVGICAVLQTIEVPDDCQLVLVPTAYKDNKTILFASFVKRQSPEATIIIENCTPFIIDNEPHKVINLLNLVLKNFNLE